MGSFDYSHPHAPAHSHTVLKKEFPVKIRVLIAEDEPAHAEAIRRGLSKADGGFEIRVAGTLREFRELAATVAPDIALMDLNLPDGRATEAITSPPEAGPFPVLVMTSYGSEQAAVEAMKSGALDYLVKSPETFSGIQRTVERALREWVLLQEKRQSEQRLRESYKRFELANRATFDAIWDLDLQSNTVWRNENFQTLFGYRAEELKLTLDSWICLVHPEDLDRVKAGISLAIDSDKKFWSDQYRFKRKDGTYAEVEDRGFIEREADGKPVRMIGAMQDISERKRAEEALERNRNELQAIYDHAPVMMCVVDETRQVLYANQAFTLFTGMSSTELTAGRACGVFGCVNALAESRGCGFGADCQECPLRLAIEETLRTGRSKQNIEQSMVLTQAGRPQKVVLLGSTALIPTMSRPNLLLCLENITERKQKEEGLRESEARYRDLVENSLDLICTHDLEGKLLSLNEAAVQQMGYDRESLLNRNLSDFLDPAMRHLFAGYLSEIKETGRSRGILRVLNAAGEIRLWEYNNSLRTEGVAVPLVRGMAHDITERHRAEQALLKNEAKYRRLYDSLMDASVSVDMTGRIVEINQAYESLLGYSKEELLRLNYVDLTPERWHSIERDLVENQILARGYSDIYEKEYRRKDGAIIPVELRTFLIRDSAGRPEGMWAIVRDISERKAVAEALGRAEEKYSLAFQASPDWCAITTMEEGVFVEVNKAFERLSGFGREEVLGKSVLELGIWDRPEERLRLVDLLRRQGTVLNVEARFRLASGEVGTFMLSAEMIELEGRSLMLTAARDMTELRSLEAQFRQAQKMEAVGRLAGGVAHDFNNMLGVILGYTDLALKRLNPQEPLYHDLQEVHNAARRSADLTRQLLAFSRKQIVTPRVINLNEALTQQQKMLSRLIGEDINLKVIAGPGLWNIRLDPSQGDQILANLAVNARDAIAGVGTVTIETANVTLDEGYSRRHCYSTPGEYVLLAVSDSGCGMDQETLERIFEPFFTTKAEGQGTGLGLSTVYGIVKQNEGTIEAYSEPGRGTTFKIYFPRFRGEAVPKASDKARPLFGSETVLIVEDEPQILQLARRILEHYGYETMVAGSPGEALLLLEKHRGPLDLLLTDVIMPTMTGPELKARVNALYPGIKTVFMSGYTAEVITQRGLLEKGVAFIQKPFAVQDLAVKVRRVLDG
jgi:PAS domain S-box-containing protein